MRGSAVNLEKLFQRKDAKFAIVISIFFFAFLCVLRVFALIEIDVTQRQRFVVPAQAGTQVFSILDSRLRGNDEVMESLSCTYVILNNRRF